ncbi:MAG: DUF4347 domain-containing protein [Acidobacteriota bacterium]
MKKPKHQRILTGCYYVFLGYCLLGGVFSATNNARTLISPKTSLPLALAALAVWFFVELYLRESPIIWVSLKGEPARIKSFGIMRRLGFVGGILLLLVPFVFDKLDREQRNREQSVELWSYDGNGSSYEDNSEDGMYDHRRNNVDSSISELARNSDDRSKSKPRNQDRIRIKLRNNNDVTNKSQFRTSNDIGTDAVKGVTLRGVERPRAEDNPYTKIWLNTLSKRGTKAFVYSDAEEMVNGILGQLDEGQLIQELNLYGYGYPGLFTVGNGQSDEFKNLTYLTPDNLAKEEWRNVLEPLKDRFLPGAKINLVGCDVGAKSEGAELLYHLSKALGVRVSAPVGKVRGGENYSGRWQFADPEWTAPPTPIIATPEASYLDRFQRRRTVFDQ